MNSIKITYELAGFYCKHDDLEERFVNSVAFKFNISNDTVKSLLDIYVRLNKLLGKTFIDRLKNPTIGACAQLLNERYRAALKVYRCEGPRYCLSNDEIEDKARAIVDAEPTFFLPELDNVDEMTSSSVLYSIFVHFGKMNSIVEKYEALSDKYRNEICVTNEEYSNLFEKHQYDSRATSEAVKALLADKTKALRILHKDVFEQLYKEYGI